MGRENFAVRAKLDGSNAVATQYLLSDKIDDGLGRIDVGGTTEVRWTLTDFQKSVRTILDGTGAVIGDLAYDAFGNKTLETAPTMSGEYGYTGREWDKETELQYNRARWYDPKTARWLTQDPLGFDAGDTNLYRYVNKMPTMAVDPSGLQDVNAVGLAQELKQRPEWTVEKAKGILRNQIKEWRGKGWNFTANLLEHFVANTGNVYRPSKKDVDEVKDYVEPQIRYILGKEGPEVWNSFANKFGTFSFQGAMRFGGTIAAEGGRGYTASAYQTCVSDRTSVRNAVLAMHETILPRRLSFLG